MMTSRSVCGVRETLHSATLDVCAESWLTSMIVSVQLCSADLGRAGISIFGYQDSREEEAPSHKRRLSIRTHTATCSLVIM